VELVVEVEGGVVRVGIGIALVLAGLFAIIVRSLAILSHSVLTSA